MTYPVRTANCDDGVERMTHSERVCPLTTHKVPFCPSRVPVILINANRRAATIGEGRISTVVWHCGSNCTPDRMAFFSSALDRCHRLIRCPFGSPRSFRHEWPSAAIAFCQDVIPREVMHIDDTQSTILSPRVPTILSEGRISVGDQYFAPRYRRGQSCPSQTEG